MFLLGGGSRDDIGSLVILRPVAVIACGYALWTLNADTARHYRAALAIAVAGMVLVVMQLVPLPPAVWTTLPGHGIVSDIDRTAGLGALWRPWTMSPTGTWNALFALFVPLAALLLGIQLPREDQFRLLGVIGGLGLLSALVGLLQTLGPANGPLYFYQITNNGFAVGLFANRNHAATLLACIFPMLAVYASIERSAEVARFRSWAALMLAAALLPLILVTGSRAGLLLSVIGLGLAALLHRQLSAVNTIEIELPARAMRAHAISSIFWWVWRWPASWRSSPYPPAHLRSSASSPKSPARSSGSRFGAPR